MLATAGTSSMFPGGGCAQGWGAEQLQALVLTPQCSLCIFPPSPVALPAWAVLSPSSLSVSIPLSGWELTGLLPTGPIHRSGLVGRRPLIPGNPTLRALSLGTL